MATAALRWAAAEQAALASPFDAFCAARKFRPSFSPLPLQIYLVRLIARQNHVVDVIRVTVIAAAPVESVQSEYSEFPQPAAARLASVMLQVEAETLDLRRSPSAPL